MNSHIVIKIPQIARWRIAGVTDTKIASLLGMSTGGLARILALPEYKEYETALLNGHISAMDKALAGKVQAIHHEFRQAVPAAVRCILDTVTQRRDLKAALEAAKTIFKMDPDRTFTEAGQEVGVEGLPSGILDTVVEEGNKVSAALNKLEQKAAEVVQ
jgi:hypothetical protein